MQLNKKPEKALDVQKATNKGLRQAMTNVGEGEDTGTPRELLEGM